MERIVLTPAAPPLFALTLHSHAWRFPKEVLTDLIEPVVERAVPRHLVGRVCELTSDMERKIEHGLCVPPDPVAGLSRGQGV